MHLLHVKKLLASPRFSLALGVLSGFAVFYFLYFFQAFGISLGTSYSGHSHLVRSASFGLLTLAYLAVFERWLKPPWVHQRYVYALLWYLGLLLLGAHLVFLLFNFFWN